MAEKVESSALLLSQYITKGTPIHFVAGLENAKFLEDHRPPEGIRVIALENCCDLLVQLGLQQAVVTPESAPSNKSFWPMAALALLAVGAVFAYSLQGDDEKPARSHRAVIY